MPVAPLVAFLDANVLYPALLRNVVMYFAVARLYRPLWSDAVHAEWMSAVRRDRPDLTEQQIERTRRLMMTHVRDATVTGYEGLIDQLVLPDPNDRHVLAAAIHGGARLIVTSNLRHFPAKSLKPHSISARHPDAFLVDLVGQSQDVATAALREMRLQMKAPPFSVSDLLAALECQKLKKTVAMLRPMAGQL
jgi:predicted nucleic acid-binding protein